MRPTLDLLSQYAAYHRDQRNIASHFVGVPLIVFAIGVLLAQPVLAVGSLSLTPAWVAWMLAATWYLRLGPLVLSAFTSLGVAVLIGLAQSVVQAGGSLLAWGVGVFVLGWAIQFVGHWYEGKKPAFVDDVIGLVVAPLFVTAEALFALGWRRDLLAQIEQRVGPSRLRDMARIG
jgi:uncharacterized membrane protein YGL010W